jgi:guanylate kinase
MQHSGLVHREEFQKVLQSYHLSPRAAASLQDVKLVLMLAASSTGRNTIIRHLLETGEYHYIISDTTRQPRVNDGVPEENGREYWFRSEEAVLADLKAGEFLEAEIIHDQQVSGISIREMERAKAEGKVAITDIELQGMHNVVQAKSDTVAIMLLPPSFEEWQKRMMQRGRMSQAEQQRRLQTALRIFQDGLSQNYYRFVIAENMDQSAGIIASIVSGGHNPHQDIGRGLLQKLKGQLEEKLLNPSF